MAMSPEMAVAKEEEGKERCPCHLPPLRTFFITATNRLTTDKGIIPCSSKALSSFLFDSVLLSLVFSLSQDKSQRMFVCYSSCPLSFVRCSLFVSYSCKSFKSNSPLHNKLTSKQTKVRYHRSLASSPRPRPRSPFPALLLYCNILVRLTLHMPSPPFTLLRTFHEKEKKKEKLLRHCPPFSSSRDCIYNHRRCCSFLCDPCRRRRLCRPFPTTQLLCLSALLFLVHHFHCYCYCFPVLLVIAIPVLLLLRRRRRAIQTDSTSRKKGTIVPALVDCTKVQLLFCRESCSASIAIITAIIIAIITNPCAVYGQ